MKQLYILGLSFISIGSLQAQLPSFIEFRKTNFLKTASQFLAPTQTTEQTSNISVYPYPLTDKPTSIFLEIQGGSKAMDYFKYSGDKVVEVDEKLWYEATWLDYLLQTVHYNSAGYPDTLLVRQLVSVSPIQWDSLKTAYTYNASGQAVNATEYVWYNNQWTPDVYYQYLYEQEVDTIVMTVQGRYANETIWENGQKLRYAYNSDGKLILQEMYVWNENDWIALQRTSFSYNANGRDLLWDIKSLYPGVILDTKYDFSYNSEQKISTINETAFYMGSWVDYQYVTYDYSEFSFVANVVQIDVSVFINDGKLILNSPEEETIFIYSASGALINQFEKNAGEANCPFSVQNGIYLVKGSSGWVKKVMKI